MASLEDGLVDQVRSIYRNYDAIYLHEPYFDDSEKLEVVDAVTSTFVSSSGEKIGIFEQEISKFLSVDQAVATNSGTSALHLALLSVGLKTDEIAITQPFTFVATCNAIRYTGATPVFVDVSRETLGMCPIALEDWLQENSFEDADGHCREKTTNKIIRCCIPVHVFGHPVDLHNIRKVLRDKNIALVEDAAEGLGSKIGSQFVGTFGDVSALSFNGNKLITTGAGGCVLGNAKSLNIARHLCNVARTETVDGLFHDEIGFNYRMPNINAALGLAQLKKVDQLILKKRSLAVSYKNFFKNAPVKFVEEPPNTTSNYWLNAVICETEKQRNNLLISLEKNKIHARRAWRLMTDLPPFKDDIRGQIPNSEFLSRHLLCLPSSVPRD